MNFEDGKLAAMRIEEKKKKFDNVNKGIYAGNELLLFQPYSMLDDKVHIMIPESFQIMKKEDAKRKYPSINRPQIILTSSDCKTNFTFSIFKEEHKVIDTMRLSEEFQILIHKIQPSNQYFDQGEVVLTNGRCNWFDFKAYVLNGEVYTLLSVTNLDDLVILGMFNCPFNRWSNWKTVMIKILETIEMETLNETY